MKNAADPIIQSIKEDLQRHLNTVVATRNIMILLLITDIFLFTGTPITTETLLLLLTLSAVEIIFIFILHKMAIRVSKAMFSAADAVALIHLQAFWPLARVVRLYKFCPMSTTCIPSHNEKTGDEANLKEDICQK